MMRGRPLGPATLIDPSGAGKARNWIRKTLSRIFAQLAKHSQHAVVVEIFGLYCWWDVKGEIASQGVDDGLLRKADTAKESSTSPWHKNSFHRLIDRRGEIVDKMIIATETCAYCLSRTPVLRMPSTSSHRGSTESLRGRR